jgi:mono/diheme cytochrome c family protein
MRIRRLGCAAIVVAATLGMLASCQSRPNSAPAPALSHADSLGLQIEARNSAEAVERGSRIYVTHCAMCPGDAGKGDGDAAPAIRSDGTVVARLDDPATSDRLTREGLIEVITKGGAHTGRSDFMPGWGERLGRQVISDVADFVITLREPGAASGRAALDAYLASPPGAPADGRRLFVHHCVACHGDEGRGDGPYGLKMVAEHAVRPSDLGDPAIMGRLTDRQLDEMIESDGGHFRLRVDMPNWTVTYTPEQVRSIRAYVRTLVRTHS